MKIKPWIAAARLRTLPLSLSGIVLGSFVATSKGAFDILIFALACITTILFQILSNFANDYGDGVKGTDDNKVGEQRAVAAGEITASSMKRAMFVFSILGMFSALGLIYLAFKENFLLVLLFFLLAAASIWAAIKYTVGSNSYGYAGLGDLFVFLFFGLLAVVGTFTLFHGYFWVSLFLPASSIGLLSMAVLNLNNMRDQFTDAESGKNTIVVRMGFAFAKKYHSLLVILPFLFSTLFVWLEYDYKPPHFSFLLLLVPLVIHLKKVHQNKEPAALDGELKKVALSTFIFALLLGGSLLVF